MIECPNCRGLSPVGTMVCGACGTSLENVNNSNNNSNNINTVPNSNNDGIVLYEKSAFNNPVNTNDIKDKNAGISVWHIILFIASVLSWIFIPTRLVKLGLAFLFFYIAESSNRKNSIFLIFVRIVTAIEILGFVIALLLRIFASTDVVAKYFEYFKF